MTERDDTTGLDHTWWRKYENRSGRWTSPDPLRGTIGAPQTFNAYTYAANDPVNFVDPTGLDPQDPPSTTHIDPVTGQPTSVPGINAGVVTVTADISGGTIGGSALGMFGADANQVLAVLNFQELKREYNIIRLLEDAQKQKEDQKKLRKRAWDEYEQCVRNSTGFAEYRRGLQGVPVISSPLPNAAMYGGRVAANKLIFGINIISRANLFSLVGSVALWGFTAGENYKQLEARLHAKHLAPVEQECKTKIRQKYGFVPTWRDGLVKP